MSRLALTSRRSVPCVVLLALATGCIEDSESQDKLSPVMGQDGVITYQYKGTDQEIQGEPAHSIDLLKEWQQIEENRRRQKEHAYQNALREHQQRLEERAWQDRQDQLDQANLDSLHKAQRAQSRQEDRDWQHEQRQSTDLQQQRIQSEALGHQQTSQTIDNQLRLIREQQQRDQQEQLRRHR